MINSIDLSRIDFHSFNRSKNLIGSFYWRGFDENQKEKYEYVAVERLIMVKFYVVVVI